MKRSQIFNSLRTCHFEESIVRAEHEVFGGAEANFRNWYSPWRQTNGISVAAAIYGSARVRIDANTMATFHKRSAPTT